MCSFLKTWRLRYDYDPLPVAVANSEKTVHASHIYPTAHMQPINCFLCTVCNLQILIVFFIYSGLLAKTQVRQKAASEIPTPVLTKPNDILKAAERIHFEGWEKASNVIVLSLKEGFQSRYGQYITSRIRFNHETYCQHRGYDYYVADVSIAKRSVYFENLRILHDFLIDYGYQYVFWKDYDSIFVNFSLTVEDMFAATGGKYDMIGSQGWKYWQNAGHMILKNTQWSQKFLEDAWAVYPHSLLNYNQGSLGVVLKGRDVRDRKSWGPRDFILKSRTKTIHDFLSKENEKHVYLFPHHVFNSYPGMWPDEDHEIWAVHVAGFQDKKPACIDYALEKLRTHRYAWYPPADGRYEPYPSKCQNLKKL